LSDIPEGIVFEDLKKKAGKHTEVSGNIFIFACLSANCYSKTDFAYERIQGLSLDLPPTN
jgi:hypothetical protein